MKYRQIIFLSTFFISSNLFAHSNVELTRYFKDQINSLNHAIIETAPTVLGQTDVDQMLYLNQFLIKLRAPIAFKIIGLANFQIIPEAEFVWQRAAPKGWTNYLPL